MASKKKRVAKVKHVDDRDVERDAFMEEDEDIEEHMEMVNEEVQVEFEARNPEDCDFDGIRKLLQQLFLKANVNLSQLTEIILSQNYVGSVIKQSDLPEEDEEDEDGDIFGIISIVNITEKKNLDCIKQIKSMLLNECHQCSQKQHDKMAAILNDVDDHLGLILAERFINIPAQLALPSYQSLWKEVEKAKQKNMKYDFANYLLISKTCKMPKTHANKGQKEQLVFVNTEEEYFYQESSLSFSYSVAGQHDTVVGGAWDDEDEKGLEPLRTVMVVSAEKIPTIMAQMKENLALPGT